MGEGKRYNHRNWQAIRR